MRYRTRSLGKVNKNQVRGESYNEIYYFMCQFLKVNLKIASPLDWVTVLGNVLSVHKRTGAQGSKDTMREA